MSAIDLIFILTIALLTYWGFKTGAADTAIWLVAGYAIFVINGQVVGRTIPLLDLPENYLSIATFIGYIVFAATVFTLARWASKSMDVVLSVPPLGCLNRLGGALLGGLLGIFAVAALVTAAAILTYVIPEGALDFGGVSYASSFSQIYIDVAPRSWLDDQLTHSFFARGFSVLPALILPFAPREIGLAVEVMFDNLK